MRNIFLLFLIFFNWFTQAQNVAPEVVITTGHNDYIHNMVMSDNGKYLASASNNKIIKIWMISNTMEYRTISGFDGRVDQMDFADDNIHLAAISSHDELLIWNVLTGELEHKYTGSGTSKGLAFFHNDEKIVHAGEGGYLSVTTLATGETKKTDVYAISMTIDKNKEMAYVLDHKGNMTYFDLKTESIVKTVKLFSEFNFPFTRGDITEDGKFIAYGFNDDKLRLWNVDQEKFVYESPKYDSKLVDIKFDHIKHYLYITTHGGKVQIFDYEKQKVKKQFEDPYFASQCLTSHPKGDIIVLANSTVIRFYNVKTKKIFKELGGKVHEIVNMAYDQQGNYLAVASNAINIQIWDLRLNKIVRTIQGFFPCEFTPDGKHLISMHYSSSLAVWNVETGEELKKLDTEYELIQCLSVSPDGKTLAGAGFMNTIKIWDLESGKMVSKIPGHTQGINSLDFHPTEPWIASASHDQTSRVWNYETKKEITQFNDQVTSVSGVKFSPDGKILATSSWDKTIKLRNTADWSTTHTLEGHVNMITSIDFNKDGSVLVSGAANNAVWQADNSVIFWDVKTGALKCQIKDHQGGVSKVIFDKSADRVFSSADDGMIKINDYKKCEVVASYLSLGEKEFMIFTPDNYYMASRNALRGIAFRINYELVPFEQFDIYLNRPDIVAQRIGKSPEQLIKAYNYLYKKRLRKLDMDEGSLELDYKIPKLLIESPYDLVTSEGSLKMKIKVWDDLHNIQQVNIFVNDVPIFGEKGFRPTQNGKSYDGDFEIPLINGVNKIQLSCMNVNGAESLYETLEIIREGDPGKHDLYIVAMGVSDYQDERFKLTYPTKDAADIVDQLKQSAPLYNEIHTKMLLNEDATAENFNSLTSFFENCTHEDMAIIFIAGHGVLNVDFDYFFGTYDMDFNNPETNGLSYDAIHQMLNQIKAYRKLLIMDTCHSGELDKEEIESGDSEPVNEDSDIEFRSAGVGVRSKEGFGFENSLELMQDLFSDTRKGSGATVISSAGGAEYAMESDQWNNGLFTYVFLSGLQNYKADLNNDRSIQVSEIRAYVNQRVKELSGGKQIPSSREENISQDYIIFGN